MDNCHLGLIRVMTLPENENRKLEQELESLFPGLKVSCKCLQGQPEGIHDDITYKSAEPKVVAAARDFAQEGVAAILVNCAADPGVVLARQEVNIPVVGAGSAAALIARAIGKPVGTLGLSAEAPAAIKETLGPYLVASIAPAGVKTPVDLRTTAGRQEIIETGLALKEKGAGCILFACTGFSLLGVAAEIRQHVGLPVVDPLFAAVMILSHSIYGSKMVR